jgi:flagellar L-ring protein precursor FlgH
MRIVSLVILGSLFLTGCVSTQNKSVVKDDPYYAPIYPEQQAEQIVATGSLLTQIYQTICMVIKKPFELAIF